MKLKKVKPYGLYHVNMGLPLKIYLLQIPMHKKGLNEIRYCVFLSYLKRQPLRLKVLKMILLMK